MENSNHEAEFEKKLELKRCREDRSYLIKEIGYSDEYNPFGDNGLSLPFIWEKRLEEEKKNHFNLFQEKCKSYPWYKWGVCPINIFEIQEIKRRRENFEDKILVNKSLENESFDYEEWLENEKKFEKLQVQYLSIIRIKEHREKIFDVFFWKLVIYSYFTNNDSNFEERISSLTHSLLSLTLIGLNASLEYILKFRQQRLISWLEEIMRNNCPNSKAQILDMAELIGQHKKLKNTVTEVRLISEWSNILDYLEMIVNVHLNSGFNGISININEDKEIQEIVDSKTLDELFDILNQAQKLANEEYWKKVIFYVKFNICKMHIQNIEDTYNENIQEWASQLVTKYNFKFPKKDESKTNDFKVSREEQSEFKESEKIEDETVDQLIHLPVIEFPFFTNRNEKSIHRNFNSKLKLPIVYSMIKARYIWNQYNKNYYSSDSLPPKIIQGYRFKIKYPILERPEYKHIIPTWYLTSKKSYFEENNFSSPNGESLNINETILEYDEEACLSNKLLIISCNQRIYKDIGFSIIDKEWDMNAKNGFRSYFENGTLYLNFNFKHLKYKR